MDTALERERIMRWVGDRAARNGGWMSRTDLLGHREAHERGLPLVLFLEPEANVYVPVQPVYVVADDAEHASSTIALDESFRYMADITHPTEDQRRYAVRLARQRLHHPPFRGRVLRAIHHSAHDRELLGISPEHRVQLDRELLEDVDGPHAAPRPAGDARAEHRAAGPQG